VLGLDAATIASAFLVAPATMGQRLSRAKSKIRAAGIPFRVPEREELPARLGAVLDAVYAAFAEGWIDANGSDVARRDLASEAVFLGRLVVELLPEQPEPIGLLALMLFAEARRSARCDANGDFVPFAQQDVARWDHALVDEAEALLHRASTMGSIGRFQLEAAIQSAHVARRRSDVSNWPAIVMLYDGLLAITGSPVVAINRALAIAEVDGADAALASIESLAGDARLAEYQPYWVARSELLARAQRCDEAARALDIAIGLTRENVARAYLLARRKRLGG
jgi:RNA polymerase sigma-70 factor (ECF subfamily)